MIVYLISTKFVSWEKLKYCVQQVFQRSTEIFQADHNSEFYTGVASILQAASQRYPSEVDSLIAAFSDKSENDGLKLLLGDVFVNAKHHFFWFHLSMHF